MEPIGYTIETSKNIDEVVSRLEKLAPEHQFRVLAVHDVQATLAEKGLERSPLTIVEVCNSGFAHKALGISIDVAMFMPCRYTVYTEGNGTKVTLAKPSMISQMLPGIGLEELAADVEQRLKRIMEEAVR